MELNSNNYIFGKKLNNFASKIFKKYIFFNSNKITSIDVPKNMVCKFLNKRKITSKIKKERFYIHPLNISSHPIY